MPRASNPSCRFPIAATVPGLKWSDHDALQAWSGIEMVKDEPTKEAPPFGMFSVARDRSPDRVAASQLVEEVPLVCDPVAGDILREDDVLPVGLPVDEVVCHQVGSPYLTCGPTQRPRVLRPSRQAGQRPRAAKSRRRSRVPCGAMLAGSCPAEAGNATVTIKGREPGRTRAAENPASRATRPAPWAGVISQGRRCRRCPGASANREAAVVFLRGWVLGLGQWTARTTPKRGPVGPEPDGPGRPSSLRAVP